MVISFPVALYFPAAMTRNGVQKYVHADNFRGLKVWVTVLLLKGFKKDRSIRKTISKDRS